MQKARGAWPRVALARALIGCLVAATCLGSVLNGPAASARSPRVALQPNIILITTDDQTSTDLFVMRHVLARLAHRGTTFSNAYSPYPLCCPARATILTGQYAHNHHVYGNGPPYGGFQAFDDSNTLPLWLQRGGYSTAIIGKYLNGYPAPGGADYVAPGWDDWRVPVKGIYNYRRWTLNENGQQVPYAGRYETNFVGDEASSIVESLAPRQDPYFLWAGFLAPHDGTPVEADDPRGGLRTPNVATRYRGVLADVRLPAKQSINEADVTDKPSFIQDLPLRPRTALRTMYQQRLESLLSVDDAVDHLLTTVKATGEQDNTVILFTSDNGFLVGEHRRTGKDIGYEEATSVPLVVAGPGFDTGRTLPQKVSLADIAPTIATLASVSPRLVEDGQSLTTFAADPGLASQRPILLEGGPNRREPDRWYSGIHTDRYVYVDYSTTHEKELYDLKTDPQQLDNLAVLDPGSPPQHRLARALTTLERCSGAVCRQSVNRLAH